MELLPAILRVKVEGLAAVLLLEGCRPRVHVHAADGVEIRSRGRLIPVIDGDVGRGIVMELPAALVVVEIPRLTAVILRDGGSGVHSHSTDGVALRVLLVDGFPRRAHGNTAVSALMVRRTSGSYDASDEQGQRKNPSHRRSPDRETP